MKQQKRIYKISKNKRFYSAHFDVLGSYTGNGFDGRDYEEPEQDADDL